MPSLVTAALRDEACDIETTPERLNELAQIAALRHLVAGNPATATATLRTLLNDSNPRVKAIIAKNPNASFALLRELLPYYAEKVLQNPVLPFLLIENPALPAQLTIADMGYMLRYANVPTAFLRYALTIDGDMQYAYNSKVSASDIRNQARMHIDLAGEAGDTWYNELVQSCGAMMSLTAEDSTFFKVPDLFPRVFLDALLQQPATHRYVAQSPDLTEEMFTTLVEGGNTVVLEQLACNPATPLHILELLASSSSVEVRRAVAKHPQLSLKVLTWLAYDAATTVQVTAARNAIVPLPVLQDVMTGQPFAHDDTMSAIVRERIALHPDTSAASCTKLATDTVLAVRVAVAKHPHTPPYVLAILAYDIELRVRVTVAGNQHTPTATIGVLARDDAWEVRGAVAASPHLTSDFIKQLISDRSLQVQEMVVANPLLSVEMIERLFMQHNNKAYLRGLAQNPHTPSPLLMELAKSKNMVMSRLLAAHPALPIAAQDKLLQTHDDKTLLVLAQNPVTALAILARLGEQGNPELLAPVATHPAMNAATRRSVYSAYFATLMQRCNVSDKARLFAIVANIRLAPLHPKLCHSVEWLDRFEIANYDKTSRSVLIQLSQDGNRYIQAAARATMHQATLPHDNTVERGYNLL